MDNRIGKARREYSEKFGKFTQEDAARFFGVSVSTYQKWEQGQGMMNGAQLREIAKKYGKSVDYLLMVDAKGMEPKKEERVRLTPDEQELVDVMRKVTPEGQRQLLIYARGIAQTYSKSNKAGRAS